MGESLVRTNREALLTVGVAGEIWPPRSPDSPYMPGVFDRWVALPGMGGVVPTVSVGDPAFGWATDHLEPGVKLRHPKEAANNALQFLACVGNRARVLTGLAAGAIGRVFGQHAYVMVEFPAQVLADLAVGDRVVVYAHGQGLALPDHPAVVVKNCDPVLLDRWGWRTEAGGALAVPVSRVIPRTVMGAGVGMASDYANCDLMFRTLDAARAAGLTDLRIGDVVALQDQDHRFGRGFRRGAWTIGVVSTGMGHQFGHGPGVTTLVTGPPGAIQPILVDGLNLRDLWA
jgi:hypothetical protein